MSMKDRILAAAWAAALLTAPGMAGATDDPNDLSAANRALFIDRHLDSIKEPAVLVYGFEKKGTLEKDKAFIDTIEEEVTEVNPNGGKDLTFQFLNGSNNIHFRDFPNQTRNPIFILFLERDVREMERLTEGNALYFRNRIKDALAGYAEMKDVTFDFDGRTLKGTAIRIMPYLNDPLNERYPRYAKKAYEFILSKDVPGGVYKITATTPDPLNDEPLTEDSMTFVELRQPEIKKAQSGENGK